MFSDTAVTVTYTVVDIPLAEYKQRKIAKAYHTAKRILDTHADGYSLAEVATWPAIQADVIAYNTSGAIGAALQQAAYVSAYTVAEVAAIVTPKIAVQVAALSDRAAAVAAILEADDHASV